MSPKVAAELVCTPTWQPSLPLQYCMPRTACMHAPRESTSLCLGGPRRQSRRGGTQRVLSSDLRGNRRLGRTARPVAGAWGRCRHRCCSSQREVEKAAGIAAAAGSCRGCRGFLLRPAVAAPPLPSAPRRFTCTAVTPLPGAACCGGGSDPTLWADPHAAVQAGAEGNRLWLALGQAGDACKTPVAHWHNLQSVWRACQQAHRHGAHPRPLTPSVMRAGDATPCAARHRLPPSTPSSMGPTCCGAARWCCRRRTGAGLRVQGGGGGCLTWAVGLFLVRVSLYMPCHIPPSLCTAACPCPCRSGTPVVRVWVVDGRLLQLHGDGTVATGRYFPAGRQDLGTFTFSPSGLLPDTSAASIEADPLPPRFVDGVRAGALSAGRGWGCVFRGRAVRCANPRLVCQPTLTSRLLFSPDLQAAGRGVGGWPAGRRRRRRQPSPAAAAWLRPAAWRPGSAERRLLGRFPEVGGLVP